MNKEKNPLCHNIDYTEIAKFAEIAYSWWDPEGKFKTLHHINPLRLSYIIEQSGSCLNKKILDVGCGGGILAESMALKGARVTGLDVSYEPLQVARLHALQYGVQIEYVQETVEKHLTKHPKYYDLVTCMEVLEHVPNPQSMIITCSKLIKPGGHVFFSTINRNYKAWLITVLGAEYILRIIPKGTHQMKKFIKPIELFSWINKTCLKKQHIVGLHYNLLSNKFTLGPSIDINYIVCATAQD